MNWTRGEDTTCPMCEQGDKPKTYISLRAQALGGNPILINFTHPVYAKITTFLQALETLEMIKNQAVTARAFKLRRLSIRSRR